MYLTLRGLWTFLHFTPVETRRKLVILFIVPQFLYSAIMFSKTSVAIRGKLKVAMVYQDTITSWSPLIGFSVALKTRFATWGYAMYTLVKILHINIMNKHGHHTKKFKFKFGFFLAPYSAQKKFIQNGVNIQDGDFTFSHQSAWALYFRHFQT
jgi:hypothetical protein